MGFLDKFLAKVGRGSAATAGEHPAQLAAQPAQRSAPLLGSPKAPLGSLKLATGDFVTHYRERFIVAGVRRLEGGGSKFQHYCLRDANGGAAVLAVEEGAEPVYSMQRALTGELPADADLLDVADGHFKLAKRGEMKVRSWDDVGAAAAVRSMTYREHRDPADDRFLMIEDYEGRREVRVGEPVFEAELECERAGVRRRGGIRTTALGGAAAFEEAKDDDVAKGSPRAAARVLEHNVGSSPTSRRGLVEDENDPSTYVDEWSDANDTAPEAARIRAKASAKPVSAEVTDEWGNATRLVREQPGARRRTDP